MIATACLIQGRKNQKLTVKYKREIMIYMYNVLYHIYNTSYNIGQMIVL